MAGHIELNKKDGFKGNKMFVILLGYHKFLKCY